MFALKLKFILLPQLIATVTHMKTLTNWNINIVDNCSNVGCDKITTVNHTRYNVLLYIYNHVKITNICTTYYISFQES